MTLYELMVILDPKISADDRKAILDRLLSLFTEVWATIKKEEIWWEKKLAYKIRSSNIGFYGLFEIEMDGKYLKDITKRMNLETSIWRFMFTKKED